ncbi:hypothetical protein MTOK_36090 [Mycolicibacterium tokaiense]|nr:hypothetical protein MTOK_36090 [Mycolicibacterium tokaiense]
MTFKDGFCDSSGLSVADEAALGEAPWLEPYLEPGDIGLSNASVRWQRAQEELETDPDVRAIPRARTAGGLLTTELDPSGAIKEANQ